MGKPSAVKTARKQRQRDRSEALFRAGLAKQAAVGINPKYLNSYRRAWVDYTEAQWKAASKAWDQAHGATNVSKKAA